MAKRDESERPRKPLSARQEKLAACLASGMRPGEACDHCNVGTTTLWEWKKLPAFTERIAQLRKELVDRAIGRLSEMMAGRAADALLKLLESKSDSVRLDSVKAVFDLFINTSNAAELKARIDALEADRQGEA
jgi:hypothetical protein